MSTTMSPAHCLRCVAVAALTAFLFCSSSTVAATDQVVSIQSKNFPDRGFARKSNDGIYLTPIFWKCINGLDGQTGSVSFQSVADPDKYLRHQNGLLYEHTDDGSSLFRKDATYYQRQNHYFTGYDAYESVNFNNHFLRHAYSRLKKSNAGSNPSSLFKNDASYTIASTNPSVTTAPVSLRSKNFPAHGWYRSSTSIYIIRIYWRIVPGLDGQTGSISFQSVTDSNRYIRHESFLLFERTNDGTSAFKKAATFYKRENYFYSGYDAYESVQYANCFIRHAYSRFQIANNDGSTLFKNDASFKQAVA